MNFILYKISNKINGKAYIGQTSKPLKERMASHIVEAKHGRFVIHKAISKYGINNFIWKIICHCRNREELNLKEVQYIELFQTKVPNGYNLTEGGGGLSGFKLSREARKKISESHIGEKLSEETKKKMRESKMGSKNPMYGRNRKGIKGHSMSKENKEKLFLAHKNIPMSEETKLKMSLAKKDRPSPKKGCKQPSTTGENNPSCSPEVRQIKREKMLGRKFGPVPEERKKRMSLAHTGKKFSEEHKLHLSIALKKYWAEIK